MAEDENQKITNKPPKKEREFAYWWEQYVYKLNGLPIPRVWKSIKQRRFVKTPLNIKHLMKKGESAGDFHFYSNLASKINLADINTKIGNVKDIEINWSGYDENGILLKNSSESILKEIEETYGELGIFLDFNECVNERRLVMNGSGLDLRGKKENTDTDLTSNEGKKLNEQLREQEENPDAFYFEPVVDINFIRKGGKNESKKFWFPVPWDTKIDYTIMREHEMEYRVGYMGTTNNDYKDAIVNTIEDICNYVSTFFEGGGEKKVIETISKGYVRVIGELWEDFLSSEKGIDEQKDLEDMGMDKILKNKQNIAREMKGLDESITNKYGDVAKEDYLDIIHKFKIIDVHKLIRDDKKLRGFTHYSDHFSVREEEEIPHRSFSYDKNNNKSVESAERKKKNLITQYGDIKFFKKIELDSIIVVHYSLPGLDENGMPLEVDEEGNVLKDKFKGRSSIRRVDPQFIKDVDLLEKSVYIDAQFDSIRDDFRDGRYHPDSLSIFEYFMDKYSTPEGMTDKLYDSLKNLEKGKHLPYEMKFRSKDDKRYVKELKFKSDHLNPAFDYGFLEDSSPNKKETGLKMKFDKHPGRINYYDTARFSIFSKNRTVSTRGMSNFLVSHVMDHVARYEQVKKVLDEIGGESRFDFGPSTPRWSKEYTTKWNKPMSESGKEISTDKE